MIEIILMSMWLLTTALCFWVIYCNNTAYRDRISISDAVFSSPDWSHLLRDFHKVEYKDHFFRIFTFRDPLAIYPPSIQSLMRGEWR